MKLQLTHKSSNANLCQHLMHNDYIVLIAFFCDIKCFKKSLSWMGFELITCDTAV